MAEQPLSTEELSQRIKPAVVKILLSERNGKDAMGAGCLIAPDLIATNAHVIGMRRSVTVLTSRGEELPVLSIEACSNQLDLALLRIAPSKIKPLSLGDSAKVKQGQSVVAMGNPLGLEFSVVEGVISAVRDIEGHGKNLIQVAIPIERGNSGGPLVDRNGQLLGLLTLKSLMSENLGFAIPAHAIQKLIQERHPIPFKQWVKIGVLSEKMWQPIKGGGWARQSSGIIRADSFGDNVGGRCLCLWQQLPAFERYEIKVQVRLKDESGAAGIAFCADGADTHYGFYPSAGQLRFTRFAGPDMHSWDILQQKPIRSYKPNQWNELRVLVTPAGVQAWVNDELAVDSKEHALRGGRVGLCKFRDTIAEFRSFQLRDPPTTLPPAQQKSLTKSLQTLLQKQASSQVLQELSKISEPARQALTQKATELEKQAQQLRSTAQEVHQLNIGKKIQAVLQKPDAYAEAALLLAQHDLPELELQPYFQMLDDMANDLLKDPAIKSGGKKAIARLSQYLFAENGFHVPEQFGFQQAENHYLSTVLDDRVGLPIMLSIIYLELARRCDIQGVYAAALPLRFMVGLRLHPEDEVTLIDVANGGRMLTLKEAADSLGLVETDLMETAHTAAAPMSVVLRILNNLTSPYRDGETELSALAAAHLSLHISLKKDSPGERMLRAQYYIKQGNQERAKDDLRWIIDHHSENLPPALKEQLMRLFQTLE
jgi:regulator of sirC expression with transglutaminase-like and TPR domain